MSTSIIFVFISTYFFDMPPRKVKSEKGNDSNKKMGRPSGNPMEDSHPRLLTNYMRTQPMVYDSSIETPRNEV